MNDSSSLAALLVSLRTVADALSPGDRLPSSRELVHQHQVSPVTVSRAIAALAAEGVVVSRPGSGTYVAARAPLGAASSDTSWQTVTLTDRAVDTRSLTDGLGAPSAGTIRLDGGYLHQSLQPTGALSSALARAARRPDAWDRAPTNGLSALRTVFAAQVGAGLTADDVLITAGGQSALSTVFRAVAGPGSPILMESPTYPGAIAAARAAGLRPTPVPMDADGIRTDLLADAFALTGARLLYCQPTFHNPTGVVLVAQRRKQVVELAGAAGAFVVEDDFARHLGHGAPVLPPLVSYDQNGTVVHVTSLTKPAAPSLRIGALLARGPVLERMQAARLVEDFFVARPLQEAALELLGSPAWDRHLRTLATALRERCHVLSDALALELPDWTLTGRPGGGLHVWLGLPPGADSAAVSRAARRHGVAVNDGSRCFVTEVPDPYLRVGFAAADRTELVEGVRRLKQAASAATGGTARRSP